MSELLSDTTGLRYRTWRNERIPRFVLGTAQLGMTYGIANKTGCPKTRQSYSIVQAAWESGVRFFDTAQDYGDAETILGDAFDEIRARTGNEPRVITKLSHQVDASDPAAVCAAIEASCERTRTRPVWAVLLHDVAQMKLWDEGVGDAMRSAQSSGLVRYIGVSVYSAEEAKTALSLDGVDIIQAPCNAWDQRILRTGVIEQARGQDTLLMIRSVFLQGLLTLSESEAAVRLPDAAKAAKHWHGVARALDLSHIDAAVWFALALDAPLVIGAETTVQVKETARLMRGHPLNRTRIDMIANAMAPYLNETILDPRQW